ncbi:MAG: asparaginase [Bacteroidia bacterium]
MSQKSNILLIYTGGTIGMIKAKNGQLVPFNFNQLLKEIPEIKRLNVNISVNSLKQPIDSSNMNPKVWKELGDIIYKNYTKYDGFVVLHGSDTMAFTASALSFMFQNLSKPIILTGSQLPINMLRTDGKENLITAIEIAAMTSKIKEVAIYFEYNLYRGNRTSKINTEDFEAFNSYNYPYLAEIGVNIKINEKALLKPKKQELIYSNKFSPNVAVLKIFPGISEAFFKQVLSTPNLKGLVLETFGAGNAPKQAWVYNSLSKSIKNGLTILNVSQCLAGSVEQTKYETGKHLAKAGTIDCKDMTFEAAICKLMFAIENFNNQAKIKKFITSNISGEIS